MDEIKEIQARAGISTNWDRDLAQRALKTIDDAMVDLLDELYGIEDEAARRQVIAAVEEAGSKLNAVRQALPRIK